VPDLLTLTPQGLYCPAGDFYVDPRQPVPRAVLTHAHADHASPGSALYLCARAGLEVTRYRLPDARLEAMAYGERRRLGDVELSLHPAGHIVGSAQVRLEHRGELWVFSGDYKRAPDPTCVGFQPLAAHVFVTEATFGVPVFRWEPASEVVQDILRWWESNRAVGRASVLFCHVLGKAQRLLAELARWTTAPVYLHGAIAGMTDVVRNTGVAMLPTVRVSDTARGRDFRGELVLAPITARGTPWMRRFGEASHALASGFMRIRGERRRRTLERGFALSDHADWPALLETVKETGATRVLVTHGYSAPFARALRDRGLAAEALDTHFEGEAGG
jgi:putative mRNA 3-end processing factor